MAPSGVVITLLMLAGSMMTSAAKNNDNILAARDTTATGTTASSSTSTNTGTVVITGTTLPQLVSEAEPCALLCYNAACVDSGCHAADFECVCGNPNSLVVKMGICAGKDCDGAKQFNAGDWVADMCSVYDAKPASADISSASSMMIAEISSASATATDNPVPSTASISVEATATESAASSTSSASSGSIGQNMPSFGAGLWGGAAAIVAVLF